MRGPTSQAQRAIDAMKAAGFARSDFRVKTERRNIPKSHGGGYEYGHAQITVYATAEEALPRVPLMLANEIDVTLTKGTRADGSIFYLVHATPTVNERWGEEPRLTVLDCTEPDPEYGLPKLHRDLKAWAIYSDALSEAVTSKLAKEVAF